MSAMLACAGNAYSPAFNAVLRRAGARAICEQMGVLDDSASCQRVARSRRRRAGLDQHHGLLSASWAGRIEIRRSPIRTRLRRSARARTRSRIGNDSRFIVAARLSYCWSEDRARRWCRRSRRNWTAPPSLRASWRLAARDRSCVSTSGLSRLSVGGTIWSRIASRQKIASTAPAAPSRWPIEDLVDDIDIFAAALPIKRSTAPSSMPSAMVDVPCALT